MIPGSKIDQAVELLRDAGQPVRIILYGSYGRGTPHEDSDLDFLVVLPVVRDRRREMVRLRRVLSPLRIPVDIVVASAAVFRKWSDTPGNIFYKAAREGQVVYEAA
jgi:uncharacterized protein